MKPLQPLGAAALALSLSLAAAALADDGPASRPAGDPSPPAEKAPAEKAPAETPSGKTPTGKTPAGNTPSGAAPDLVEPTPALAPLLKRFDKEAEPGRELKRAFLSVLHYLFTRDVPRALPYFHPELVMHSGGGELVPVPPKRLKAMFEAQADAPPIAGGKPLGELIRVESLCAIPRARLVKAKAAQGKAGPPIALLSEAYRLDPLRLLPVTKEGDWVVAVRFKEGIEGLPPETFYVLRRHKGRFKVALGE